MFQDNSIKLFFIFRNFFLCSLGLLFFLTCAGRVSPGYIPIAKSSPLYHKIDKKIDLVYTAHKSSLKKPFLSFANKSRFYLYAVNNQESKWVRIVFEYNGIDRLLFDKISLKNGKSDALEWDFSNNDINTNDRHGGIVHEKKDLLISQEQFKKLMQLLKPGTMVEYSFSSDYEEEYPITKESLKASLKLIEYYESIHLAVLR